MVEADGRPPGLGWHYDRAERVADGVVHALGVTLGAIGAVVLVAVAVIWASPLEIASVIVYAVGLLAMLGFSAAYNIWPVSRAKWILRRFDHSAIYLMIAGTYTPFIAQLKAGLVAAGLLAAVWSTAFLGAALKLMLPGRLDRLAVAVYLALGWSGVVAYRQVVAALPGSTLWLIAAGGVLYSAGVVFHAWRSLRFHNAIWHGFVVIAACCHYSAVLDCLTHA